MSYQLPRGTHDVLPSEVTTWQWLERTFADLAHKYGFEEIRTPMFEDTALFERSSGETSDVVTKEMYTFQDRGDRSLTLKPEGTAPVLRAYLQHKLGFPNQVTKLWYLTPFFRYERPQKGRYRQAHQLGLELIGAKGMTADAEVIEITTRFYQEIGIKDVVVLVNSIGGPATRLAYRDAILETMAGYISSIEPENRERIMKNPLRLVDSKDPAVIDLLQTAPKISDFLDAESRARFNELQELLNRAGIKFRHAPEIVRGLDYYSDTVFEVHSEFLGAQGALCGGGRYNGLMKELGGPETPSVGVGIGMERAQIVLESMGLMRPAPQPDAYVAAATPDAWTSAEDLVRELRRAGLAAQSSLDRVALKNQFKEADRIGARFAIVIGTDELAAGQVSLRDLASGEQRLVARSEVLGILR